MFIRFSSNMCFRSLDENDLRANTIVAGRDFTSPPEFLAMHSQWNGLTKNCSKYASEISAVASSVRMPLCGFTCDSFVVGGLVLVSLRHWKTSC